MAIILNSLSDVPKLENCVTTNGCFDVLHIGHIRCLQQAKALGGQLVVGVNTDESVKQLKGNIRPMFPLHVRMLQLAALSCVDYVVPIVDSFELIGAFKPKYHVKGRGYDENIPEKKLVEHLGGKLVIVSSEYETSTTKILLGLWQSQ